MTDKIKTAYEKAKTDISNLISFLECEMKKEPVDLDWSYVEGLNHIKESFTESLTAITGCKESLEPFQDHFIQDDSLAVILEGRIFDQPVFYLAPGDIKAF
jgi:phage terminase large subunit-like protein